MDDDSGANGQVQFSLIIETQGTYFTIEQFGDTKVAEIITDEVFSRDVLLNGYARINGEIKYKGGYIVVCVYTCGSALNMNGFLAQ